MADELDPEIIRKLNAGLQLTDEEMQRLARDASLANKAMATLSVTAKALGVGLVDYSKKLTAGEKGAQAFNSAISGTTGAMGDLLMKMGPLGKALGLLVKGIGGYVTAVNALSDRLYKSYTDLSKVGVTAEDGLGGLADAARRLGYGIDEVGIENFGRMMVKASEDLALMSGSAIRGRRAFVDFASQINDRGPVQQAFNNLGYSVEDLNEMSANYVQQQVSMGRASIKTERELVAETQEYVKLLDLQSKLTGQSVQALQERMDADLRNERFQAYVMKVERTEGKEAADILRLNMAAVSKQFPGIADGLKDIAAGYPTTKAAQAVFMSGMANIPKDMHKYVGAGFEELGNASRKLTSRYGEQFGAVGIFGEVFVPLNEAVKAGNLAERDRVALLEEAQRIQKEQMDGNADGVDAQTKLRISQMNTRDSLQNMLAVGINPVTSAMSGLAKVVEYLTKGLESVLGIFGYKAPKPPGAPGAPAGGAAPGTKPTGLMGAAAKNLNPGNLRFAGQKGATMGTGGFAKFENVDQGLVALANQLDMYITGKSASGRRDTIASIISAYAPPNENDTKTYIDQMASFMGKRADEALSRDPATLAKLMVGIIGKESMGGLEKGYSMRGGIQYAVAQVMGIDPSKVGQFARGGIADRLSFVGEAGAEAVVPLPGNRKIPVMLNVDNLAQKLLGSMDSMASGRGPMGGLNGMLMNMFRDMDTARTATTAPTSTVTTRNADTNEALMQLVSIFQSSNMALNDLVALQRQSNRNTERLLQAQT